MVYTSNTLVALHYPLDRASVVMSRYQANIKSHIRNNIGPNSNPEVVAKWNSMLEYDERYIFQTKNRGGRFTKGQIHAVIIVPSYVSDRIVGNYNSYLKYLNTRSSKNRQPLFEMADVVGPIPKDCLEQYHKLRNPNKPEPKVKPVPIPEPEPEPTPEPEPPKEVSPPEPADDNLHYSHFLDL